MNSIKQILCCLSLLVVVSQPVLAYHADLPRYEQIDAYDHGDEIVELQVPVRGKHNRRKKYRVEHVESCCSSRSPFFTGLAEGAGRVAGCVAGVFIGCGIGMAFIGLVQGIFALV